MPFTVTNTTNCPINIRVSNAGITYQYRNNLPAQETHVFSDLGGLAYDITAYYSSPATFIDPTKDNVAWAGGIATTVLGILGTIAGVVLLPFTGGGSGLVLAATIGVGVSGAVSTFGAVAFMIAGAEFSPVKLWDMYGPHRYDITVGGGMAVTLDPNDKTKFVIHDALPISMTWRNLDRVTSGTLFGTKTQNIKRMEPGEGLIPVTLPYKETAGRDVGVAA